MVLFCLLFCLLLCKKEQTVLLYLWIKFRIERDEGQMRRDRKRPSKTLQIKLKVSRKRHEVISLIIKRNNENQTYGQEGWGQRSSDTEGISTSIIYTQT